jgi:cell division septum initiation protein DivIVA
MIKFNNFRATPKLQFRVFKKDVVIEFRDIVTASVEALSSCRLRLTRQVPLVEHELQTIPEHLSSPPNFSGIRVVFYGSLFVLLSLFL